MVRRRRPFKDRFDPDDLALWRSVTETITPLRHRNKKPGGASLPEEPPAKPVPPIRQRVQRTPLPVAPRLPELVPGRTPGLDGRTAERLQRGRLAVEARLDLHGMTQTQAHRSLIAFIERGHAAGLRTVLVITGKGRTEGGEGAGVLRAAVPRWLNEPVLRPLILAFHPARPADGGAGALYVRLKRRRER